MPPPCGSTIAGRQTYGQHPPPRLSSESSDVYVEWNRGMHDRDVCARRNNEIQRSTTRPETDGNSRLRNASWKYRILRRDERGGQALRPTIWFRPHHCATWAVEESRVLKPKHESHAPLMFWAVHRLPLL